MTELVGQKYGKLTVLKYAGRDGKRYLWACRCSCGAECLVRGDSLKAGTSRSCGCGRLEAITSHGKSYEPEYWAWNSMKDRCTNPRNKQYKNYGGRGIRFCDSWKSFERFISDVGQRPGSEFSLDRIDNNKGYSKSNVRWATFSQQGNNRRTNVNLTHLGKTKTVAQWSVDLGIKHSTILMRLTRGWSVERTLSTPIRKY